MMFEAMSSFWSDSMIHALEPALRPVMVLCLMAALAGFALIASGLCRRNYDLVFAGVLAAALLSFVGLDGARYWVDKADFVRSLATGHDFNVVEHGETIILKGTSGHIPDHAASMDRVHVLWHAPSRIEKMLAQESDDMAANFSAILRRAGLDDRGPPAEPAPDGPTVSLG